MSAQAKQWVGLLVLLMVSPLSVSGTTASSQGMIPETVTSNAMGGVSIALRAVDSATKRLVFEIHGEDVTQLSRGVSIQFAFDATITHLSVPKADVPITIDTSVVDQTGTLIHLRSPFAPPLPWTYTVVIKVDTLPKAGHLTIGSETSHELIFHLPLASQSSSNSPKS